MIELLVLGAVAFALIVVLAVLASVVGLLLWLLVLPFRILGWLLHGLAAVLALPFVALFALLAVLVFGAGMLVFLVPFLPIVLILLGAWWLVRRNQRSAATVAR